MAVDTRIGAVVLAAGQSKRMGQPKMVMPWGEQTVIEQVISSLLAAQVAEVVVVTGGAREKVEAVLAGSPVRLVHNPHFEQSEMLVSLQYGMRALAEGECQALLVVLGDQPSVSAEVITEVTGAYKRSHAGLVVPSYQNRRGHPWLVDRRLWNEILNMPPQKTMRDFLNTHAGEIEYVLVATAGILKDLDTPEDYDRFKPAHRPGDSKPH